MDLRRSIPVVIASAGAVFAGGSALAGSHLWDITEVFTNADGSIQFIEMTEQNGAESEIGLLHKAIMSEGTGNSFVFPDVLVPPTSFKHLLLATQAFADLPGAPTPDYIIPENFFAVGGDTLRYHVYDTWVIGAGAIPTDCTHSLNRYGVAVAVNSPTNYDGDSAAVDAWSGSIADLNADRVVDTADLGALLTSFGTAGPVGDLNSDNMVDTADLGILLAEFGTGCP
ncbi:MAG: hypothetical protein H6813_02165 [Phycisphaeraceae bacterium]|nr:hypothetical protein [Phycisphaeraceae bacterium]